MHLNLYVYTQIFCEEILLYQGNSVWPLGKYHSKWYQNNVLISYCLTYSVHYSNIIRIVSHYLSNFSLPVFESRLEPRYQT